MVPPSLDLTPAWQVRIVAHGGTIAGGGVLVPGNQILTCVHVVNAALDRGDSPSPPGGESPLRVDLPHETGFRPADARVVTAAWNPERDTTLLALDSAPAHTTARLDPCMADTSPANTPRPVRVRGYPRGTPEGLTASARVVGVGGDRAHRAQLDISTDDPVRFEAGFSGCGVVDTERGSVVGILVSARYGGSEPGHVGIMEPVEMVESLSHHLYDRELEALRSVLSALRFDAVRDVYHAVAGRGASTPAGFATAWEAFLQLRQLAPTPDGLPREVSFVAGIARTGVANTATLRSYIDSRPAPEVPPHAPAPVREAPAPSPQPSGTLIVTAEPVPGRTAPGARHLLTHWVDDGETLTNGGSVEIGQTQLRESVLDLIGRVEERIPVSQAGSSTALRLDFVLPFTLLTRGIAEWRLPAPLTGEGERIGASYDLVLHSRERLCNRGWERARHKLAERWHTLGENGSGRVYHVPVESEAAADPGMQDSMCDPAIIACVLGRSPSQREGALQLGCALQTGMPAIAWLDSDDPQETRNFQEDFARLASSAGNTLTGENVLELPHWVRKCRTRDDSPPQRDRGYDPYSVHLILDDMVHIRRLSRIGILALPKRARRERSAAVPPSGSTAPH
ncbi:trypsin-like peptidase [Haloactinospora alba]|uniref:Trypsin-like peptidase n=1 Tax=Haloactinospora alba TaxID=405555 RepID=A0A543NJC2_9ACTN|nr:trypsin-like peptidase domain-containing protein [Haloactinospora alba]TQN31963.1 trypsin-like peptidase [Haloactinospora alba]